MSRLGQLVTGATPRVERLRQQLLNAPLKVCSERARLVTESYRETESDPPVMRRAKALKKVLENMSIFILNDELIVGHIASAQRNAAIYPEFDVVWLERELETISTRKQDRFGVPDNVKQDIREIIPYWKGRTVKERLFASLPADTRRVRLESGVFSVTVHEGVGLGHVLLDYASVLRRGLLDIKREIQSKLESLDTTEPDAMPRFHWWTAAALTCDAAVGWARRYAELARRMAEEETNPQRRAELEAIGQVCSRVPALPARTFHEALQSFWFTHIIPQIETNGNSITPGRFDQYMYPYLASDLAHGILTELQAQELLECLWIKFSEPVVILDNEAAAVTSGFPMGQNVVVGGVDRNGQDATNRLSFMCLEAQSHIRLGQPNFSVKLHEKSPEEFVRRAVEVIKLGGGMPQLFNDAANTQALLSRGLPLEEARDHAYVGCVENAVVGTWGRENGGYLSLPKILELAINNGVCRLTGKQVGLPTGDLRQFTSFDQVIQAYQKQLHYFVHHLVVEDNVIDLVQGELVPIPFVSLCVPGCIESGKDVTKGGARYNVTCPTGVGLATLGDSMAAIKKLVFEDKALTPDRLQRALDADFDGYEDVRQLLINRAPKYGNDNDYVDGLTREVINMFIDEVRRYTPIRGGQYHAGFTAVTAHVALGRTVGATPDGRRAGKTLSDGISPTAGYDRKGPTAVIRSVTKLDLARATKGMILNQKFSPAALEGAERTDKFINLVRTYFRLGGLHVQFNVVSAETLREAQEHPNEYRDLVVRVAGYSAFFTELSKEVQDTIIARTEQWL